MDKVALGLIMAPIISRKLEVASEKLADCQTLLSLQQQVIDLRLSGDTPLGKLAKEELHRLNDQLCKHVMELGQLIQP